VADSRDVTPQRTSPLLSGVLISSLVGACALGPSPRGAQDVVEAYAEALRDGDPRRAYALLTESEQRSISEHDFAVLLRAQKREARELAERLTRAARPRVVASVVLEDGSTITLERGPHGFRMVDPLARFYGQSSPREALLTFVRAAERERWDVLHKLMPRVDAEGVDARTVGEHFAARKEELTRTTALLWAARDQPIEVVGDRATMPYGESYTARFVLEEGLWKLEDPD
jgi:hypothetical protein